MARQFGSIRKLPSGRHQARYPAPDGQYRTAPVTFTTRKAAAAWLAEVQSDIERGRWKSPEQVAADAADAVAERAAVLTVRELAEVWLETIPSENHRVVSVSRVRRFINPELGDIPIDELTRARCDAWYAWLQAQLPGSPTQVRRVFAALHAMLKLAVHEDLIASSPLRIKGALVDVPVREPQTATAGEVEQLAAAMPAQLAMAVQLAAWCGLRAGEVLGLQVDDLVADRDTAVPLVPVLRVKLRRHIVQGRGTGSMTIVPGTKAADKVESVVVPPHLITPLWVHIAQYARKAEPRWVFPGTRNLDLPCGPATLDRHWRRARETCDLEHLVFQDLRRTGNTIAALAGATAGEMKQRLRHRSSQAAERYIVAAKGADIELAKRMSQQAANPHRTAPTTGPVTVAQIDAAVEVLGQLMERVRDAGDETLLERLRARLRELLGEGGETAS